MMCQLTRLYDLRMTSTTRWLSPQEQTAWRAYLDMTARLSAQLNRELQNDCGLSLADYAVLVQLTEHELGTMRVLELARALGWEKSRLSHHLARMQQRGLVGRAGCPSDRRGAFIALTDQGRAAIEAAAPRHLDGVRRYLFDHLSHDQVAALGSIADIALEQLAESCGATDPAVEDPCGPAAEL